MHLLNHLVLLSTLLAAIQAFTAAPAKTRTFSHTRLRAVLTADELEAILTRGHHCETSECSTEDVHSLIQELQEQQHTLYQRIQSVDKMIHSLETLNQAHDRKVDEVRDTVRAIFRIFAMSPRASGNDYPALSRPTGYSGEVGQGPTDAYKALNPKPWKP